MTKLLLSYHLLIILCLSLPCCGQKDKKENQQVTSYDSIIPEKPIGRVSDFEKVFTIAEVNYLDSIIASYEEARNNEIALVTFQLDPSQIKTTTDFNLFSLSLFRKWGVGKKDQNNGIGILMSVNSGRIRIEVGTGLEKRLTDAEVKNIIDSIIIPEFKNGAYYTGILNGLKAVFNEIE